ncbi:MAG TPA: recombinase family protein [Thermoplasmata archaeon]|nr:recombinase family protein [Thermoplasmata archaeon]
MSYATGSTVAVNDPLPGPAKISAAGGNAPPPGSKVALYLRVSTAEQDLGGQERDLRGEARRRGWTVVRTYSEKVSGTGKVERREYDRLLRDARSPDRPFDRILVWALDRFSREETFTKATQAILDLEKLGVKFHSYREPMLDTPEDGKPNLGRNVLLALLPVIAGFESQRRSERVRVAMKDIKEGRRKTRSGRPPGRPTRATPEKVAAIMKLKAEGLTYRVIAQRVGLPRGTCANVVYRVRRGQLQNPLDTNRSGDPQPDPSAT